MDNEIVNNLLPDMGTERYCFTFEQKRSDWILFIFSFRIFLFNVLIICL